MKIAIGNDHRGYQLKLHLVRVLTEMGHAVKDCGCMDFHAVDYPDVAEAVCDLIPEVADRGVLICGTGIGMSIAANKKPGIRAGLVASEAEAAACRQHNLCNVLCLGAATAEAQKWTQADFRRILTGFLEQPAQDERHQRRVRKIADLERKWGT